MQKIEMMSARFTFNDRFRSALDAFGTLFLLDLRKISLRPDDSGDPTGAGYKQHLRNDRLDLCVYKT
jgi:hypothetical protein